jgi:hypothetical protein
MLVKKLKLQITNISNVIIHLMLLFIRLNKMSTLPASDAEHGTLPAKFDQLK